MGLPFRRYESPEEARQRRRCRMMLGLPPEIEYHHMFEGGLTLGALVGLLLVVLAAHGGHLKTAASTLASALVLASLGLVISRAYRRYRHAGAGILVLAALLGLLGGSVYHRAHLLTPAAGVTPPIADSLASR